MVAVVFVGGIAATRIGISQYPDVDFPTINVSANWEGAAPAVVEGDVATILEDALVQVEGIKSIVSTSRQGSASLTLELDLDRNVDTALQDVQTKVAQAQRRLPFDVDPPVISKSNPEDQPIMWLAVSGPFSQRELGDYARYTLAERLQTLPGVGEILLGGYLERNVRIWLDTRRLDKYGMTGADVVAALERQHLERPGGRIESRGREIQVRFAGEAANLRELEAMVVRGSTNGTVRLRDVATVENGFEDVRRLSRVSGEPAQGLGIKKQRGSNAVAVGQAVKDELARLQPSLPDGMRVGVNFDSTIYVEESVAEIEFEILLSILLTAIVCWLFLGSFSSTVNVLLAIPMSLLGTVAVLYFLGETLNTFTLLGLALSVGIVVDDAIVILESIYRKAEQGLDKVSAALTGTLEVAPAALAATVAVLAIFLPIIFVEGILGKFLLPFGITLCVAVALSYLEAITLAPARSAQFLRIDHGDRTGFGGVVDRAFTRLEALYARALHWALDRQGQILLATAAALGLSIVAMQLLPKEFVPSQDQSRLMVRLQTSVGASLTEMDALMQQAEQIINSDPAVSRAFAIVGGFGGGGVNTGMMFVTLRDRSDRDESQNEVAARLRELLSSIAGVRPVVQDLSQQGFSAQRGFPVEFSIRGPDWDELVRLSEQTIDRLRDTGTVVDLDTDYQVGMPELEVRPNRERAADLGVSVSDIATTIQVLIGGTRAGKFSSDGRRIDMRVRLRTDQRSTADAIGALRVRSSSGALIPLRDVVQWEEKPTLQSIVRRDRERAIAIFANVAPGHSQQQALQKVVETTRDLPAGYRAVTGGASQAFSETFNSLSFALLVGVIFAYMILAAQFNSYLHPITILTILPLSVLGAVAALGVTGYSLNLFSMIGLLLLMGIVKKNSILLVDCANQERRTDPSLSAREAARRAGPIRLRPILMTSAATLSAALPSAIGLGPGSETRASMAVAILGGVLVSTILSLVVVPCFYVWSDSVAGRVRARFLS